MAVDRAVDGSGGGRGGGGGGVVRGSPNSYYQSGGMDPYAAAYGGNPYGQMVSNPYGAHGELRVTFASVIMRWIYNVGIHDLCSWNISLESLCC